ncbi:hypothetical protein [Kribbella sp. NPDC048915]|uniref:hypothetical protein n=1 Tax=Kribbella sp. NPDC048915 TaxID=3155148 RepID=UPI0033E90C76
MTIFWIGGPAAAGKTTVSRLFARRHGYLWYSVDVHAHRHEQLAAAAGLHDPATGPGDFDRRPMILSDLSAADTAVVVEGALITPSMAGVGPDAVWLMPSAEEQQARLNERNPGESHEGYRWGLELIRSQLSNTGATVVNVDGQSVAETLATVEQLFSPVIASATAADSPAARRSLIRTSNLHLVTHAQVRARTSVTLDCECATRTCTAQITLSPNDAAHRTSTPTPPLLATTH